MPSILNWTCILITTFISIVSIALDTLSLLVTRNILTYSDKEDDNLNIFISRYLQKDTDVTGNVWYNCSKEGDIGLAQESFHSFTDPASVEVFLTVHVVLHFIWLLSLVTLFCRSKKWTVIWVLSTLMIILYGAVVGCLFAIEIYDAVNCQGKLNDEDKETQLLISSLIIPLYMTMGIIFWILLLVLLIMQPFALRTASSGQPKQKRKNGRSLSEIPSQEYTNRLNKRFDQADALEEDEQRSSSRNSEELLIKRSNGNNNNPMKLKTRETSSTSEWVYTNPALVMNESVPHHPSVMTRQQPSSSSVQEIYSMPRTFAAMRSISRDESETSESRKIGRPVSMPPLPRVDYQLPRASLSSTMASTSPEAAVVRKKKAIRTPSGKSMSASEYLRGGYFPSQASLPEEEQAGNRAGNRY